MAVTLPLGLVLRFAPLGWPWVVAKYGGSITWALMVYWFVSALLARWPPGRSLLLAGCLATAVEYLKLWHTPMLDTFRLTLPGILLLGRHFSILDIVCYWLAIIAGAAVDHRLRRSLRSRRGSTQVA